MRQFGVVILRGLGMFLEWFVQGTFSVLRALTTEVVRGLFELVRPILPWVSAGTTLLLLWHFRPDVAEAIITLIILGLVLKMMFGGSKKKKK